MSGFLCHSTILFRTFHPISYQLPTKTTSPNFWSEKRYLWLPHPHIRFPIFMYSINIYWAPILSIQKCSLFFPILTFLKSVSYNHRNDKVYQFFLTIQKAEVYLHLMGLQSWWCRVCVRQCSKYFPVPALPSIFSHLCPIHRQVPFLRSHFPRIYLIII